MLHAATDKGDPGRDRYRVTRRYIDDLLLSRLEDDNILDRLDYDGLLRSLLDDGSFLNGLMMTTQVGCRLPFATSSSLDTIPQLRALCLLPFYCHLSLLPYMIFLEAKYSEEVYFFRLQ